MLQSWWAEAGHHSQILTMDWGGEMFIAFTVHVCQLLEGHIRPGDKRASLAVRAFAPPNKRFMSARRSILSSSIRTKRFSLVRSRTNALYSIFTWRSVVLSKNVSREFIVCLSSPMPRDCLVLMAIERCCTRRPRADQIRARFRLPAKSIARFLDFTEQPGSLHFACRRQLG
jgi:hypothetical protein